MLSVVLCAGDRWQVVLDYDSSSAIDLIADDSMPRRANYWNPGDYPE